MSDGKLTNPFRRLMNRMMETFAEHQWRALLRSYVLAMRPERRARLQAVMELSVELAKIKAESIHATAFHEQLIEAIIEGDWKEVAKINGWLGEWGSEDRGQREKLWENFRAIAMSACADAARRETGAESEDN